jgi:uncharacterized protein (TIRG00374 family)
VKSKLVIAARYLVAILAIFWLVRSGTVNVAVLRRSLTSLDLLAIALGVLLVDLTVTSWRLVMLLRARGFAITLGDALRLTLVGNLFNLVLPAGGGDVARFYYAAADASGRRAELAAILVFDRFVGLIALLVLPALLLPFIFGAVTSSMLLTSLVKAAAITALALIAGLALVIVPSKGIAPPLAWILQRLPFSAKLSQFVETIRAYRLQPSVLVGVLFVSLVAHALSGLVIAIVHSANGPFVPYAGVLSLLGFVANSIPLTPGGIGVGEAAFSALFREAGLTGGAEAMLSWRLLMIALAPLGLLIHLRGLRLSLVTTGR